jgi:hypothetical protein
MSTGVSLWLVIACGLLLTGLAFALNVRGVRLATSALVMLTVCVVIGAVQALGLRNVTLAQSVGMWLGFVALPAIAVLGVSRLPFVRTRTWALVLVGPVSYLFSMMVALTLFNIVASIISR